MKIGTKLRCISRPDNKSREILTIGEVYTYAGKDPGRTYDDFILLKETDRRGWNPKRFVEVDKNLLDDGLFTL